MTPIIQLIQIAIGKRDSYEGEINAGTVAMWFKEAKKQALIAVLAPAVKTLLKGRENYAEVKQPMFNWLANSMKVEDRNCKMNERTPEVCAALASEGIDSCVLKGQGTALLYPNPLWRVCGDIDIWVRGDRREISRKLSKLGEVRKVVWYHTEMKFFGDTDVEIHFHPSYFNDPFVNRKFNRWLGSVADEQFTNDSGHGFKCPTIEFNLVYSLVHIFKHIFSEGVGLRQMMDYYYILLASTPEERRRAFAVLGSLRLRGIVSGLMYIMKEVFLLDDGYFLVEPSEKYGKPMLEAALLGGNFGKDDPRNRHGRESLFESAWRKMKISLGTMSLCPSEVLWLPFYKIWHFCWRNKNK